ncbi:MAG: hypothetical protein J6U31_03445, partial [Bacteroidales bacterium]|nr:hypothetical protein [Bacteroidales bacterium]
MKKLLFSVIITLLPTVILSQSFRMAVENRMEQPLNQVMSQIEKQFGIMFSYNVDTTGLVVTYAPGRIRPYSLDESLQNVLSAFDFKAWK